MISLIYIYLINVLFIFLKICYLLQLFSKKLLFTPFSLGRIDQPTTLKTIISEQENTITCNIIIGHFKL